MVKPLSFKGDKKSKKRKRTKENDGDDAVDPNPSAIVTTSSKSNSQNDDHDGWITMEHSEELIGPVMLTFVCPPNSPELFCAQFLLTCM